MIRFVTVRTNRLLASLAAVLLVGAMAPAAMLAATPTSTFLTATPSTLFPGNLLNLVAKVSPSPLGGTVTFSDGATLLGETEIDPDDGTAGLAVSLALGPHSVTARFNGFGDLDPSVSNAVPVSVVLPHTTGTPTSVSLAAGPIVPAGEAQSLIATVSPTPDDGRLIFMEGNEILRTEPAERTTGQTTVTVRLEPGTHTITVIYEGSDTLAGSISPPLTIVVPADSVVSAAGLGVSHATVYPVVDGFVDTTLIRGQALERLSVIVQVFSSTGKRVRSVGLGTREGAYSFAWNAHTLAGALVPEGRYTVIQTLTDRNGNRIQFTSVVAVSHKRKVALTGVQTRTGAAFDREGTVGFGLVVPRESDDSVNVWGNVPGDSAFVAYEFSLPKAMQWRTVRAEVIGEAQPGRSGATLSLRNWTGGPDPSARAGAANGRYTVTGPAVDVVSPSRQVAFTVTANGEEDDALRVFTVRLVYTYFALQ